MSKIKGLDHLELVLLRHNHSIPQPQIGFQEDWKGRNRHLAPIRADQRACPAIARRENFGLTLFMPYTARFYRDGSIALTQRHGEDDHRVVHFHPSQGAIRIDGIRWDRLELAGLVPRDFPASTLELPVEAGRRQMGVFVLGDKRLNSWIVEAGVQSLQAVPPDYQALILPLPNHAYPKEWSVGQALTFLMSGAMHLKIPIDLHFEECATESDCIEIRRGTPMVQWVIVKMATVTEVDYETPPAVTSADVEHTRVVPYGVWDFVIVRDQIEAADASRPRPTSTSVRLPRINCSVDISMTDAEIAFMAAIYRGEPTAVALECARRVRADTTAEGLLGELSAIGSIELSSKAIPDADAQRREMAHRLEDAHANDEDAADELVYIVRGPMSQPCLWDASRPLPGDWVKVREERLTRRAGVAALHVMAAGMQLPPALGGNAANPAIEARTLTEDLRVRLDPAQGTVVHEQRIDDVTDLFLYVAGLEIVFAGPHTERIGRRLVHGEALSLREACADVPEELADEVRSLLVDLVSAGVLVPVVSDRQGSP